MPELSWSSERLESGTVVINVRGWGVGKKFRVFLVSDQHTDHPHSDLSLQKHHLDEAVACNAPIIFGGDTHDAMQSRNDRRRSQEALRPELAGSDYFNRMRKFVGDFYFPYRKNIVLICDGNHETACLTNSGQDLTADLVTHLNSKGDANVHRGGYYSWVGIRFYFTETRYCTKKILVYHGYGGSSPVTRGVIDTARTGLWLPDADVIHMGHSHSAYVVPIRRKRINSHFREFEDFCLHVRTSGYKMEHESKGGWAVEKGIAPTVQGGAWLEFESRSGQSETAEVCMNAGLAL